MMITERSTGLKEAMLQEGYGTKSKNTGKVQANETLSKPKLEVMNKLNSKEYFRGKEELNLSNE